MVEYEVGDNKLANRFVWRWFKRLHLVGYKRREVFGWVDVEGGGGLVERKKAEMTGSLLNEKGKKTFGA
jgi:hypothetical protein